MEGHRMQICEMNAFNLDSAINQQKCVGLEFYSTDGLKSNKKIQFLIIHNLGSVEKKNIGKPYILKTLWPGESNGIIFNAMQAPYKR